MNVRAMARENGSGCCCDSNDYEDLRGYGVSLRFGEHRYCGEMAMAINVGSAGFLRAGGGV